MVGRRIGGMQMERTLRLLKPYRSATAEEYRQARALLFLDIFLAVLGFLFFLVNLFVLDDVATAGVTVGAVALLLVSVYFISRGHYWLGSNFTIVLFSLFMVAMAFLGMYQQGRAPSILTRNMLLASILAVLFGGRRYQLAYVSALSVLAMAFVHLPPFYPVALTTFENPVSSVIMETAILAVAIFALFAKIVLTEKSLEEAREQAEANQRRYEKLERLLSSSKETIRTGERLVSSSQQTAQLVAQMADYNRSIRGEIEGLTAAIGAGRRAYEDIVARSDQVKEYLESQNAAFGQSRATVQEMTASIERIAEVARTNGEAVDQLVSTSGEGLSRITEAMQAMEALSQRAAGIVNVIGVIDDISDKTNLLAMNASIEAAHAGAAGRGFAVVASEVRKLAEETRQNTDAVSDTLRENTQDIQKASELNDAAGGSFELLRQEIATVADAFKQILGGMQQLSHGTGDVNSAVTSLTEMSSQVNEAVALMEQRIQESQDAMRRIAELSRDMEENVVKQIDGLVESCDVVIGESRRLERVGMENMATTERLFREIGLMEHVPAVTEELPEVDEDET